MLRINKTSAISAIKLADGQGQVVPTKVQYLRTGTFNHPVYGKFQITPAILSEMKANFDARVRGVDIAFDYFHESDKKAAAWVKEFSLEENGTELWAVVDWTPQAQQMLAERELRYFSPDFAFEWKDPETGNVFSNVIFGGGLTNRPFVKEMEAIVANENKGENMTELEKAQKEIADLKAANVKLSEDKAAADKALADAKAAPPAPAPAPADDKVKALEAQIAQLQQELAKAKADGEAALAEKQKAQEAVKMAEKETAFNKLLSEGKACAAQKDAFIKGDMDAFIKLAEPVNLRGQGRSAHANVSLSEQEKVDKILKLAEEKRKADPKLSQGEAVSLAKKEVEKQ